MILHSIIISKLIIIIRNKIRISNYLLREFSNRVMHLKEVQCNNLLNKIWKTQDQLIWAMIKLKWILIRLFKKKFKNKLKLNLETTQLILEKIDFYNNPLVNLLIIFLQINKIKITLINFKIKAFHLRVYFYF